MVLLPGLASPHTSGGVDRIAAPAEAVPGRPSVAAGFHAVLTKLAAPAIGLPTLTPQIAARAAAKPAAVPPIQPPAAVPTPRAAVTAASGEVAAAAPKAPIPPTVSPRLAPPAAPAKASSAMSGAAVKAAAETPPAASASSEAAPIAPSPAPISAPVPALLTALPAPAVAGVPAAPTVAAPIAAPPAENVKIAGGHELAAVAAPASLAVPVAAPASAGLAQIAPTSPAPLLSLPAHTRAVLAPNSAPSHTGQASPPAAQLSGAMIKFATSAGLPQRLSVQLAPQELGSVQISLTRSASGTTAVSITAERGETLALLAGDQPALQRALDQAGVPVEGRSLSFSLASSDPGGFGGRPATPHGLPSAAGDDVAEESEITTIPITSVRVGLVDITA